MTDHRTTTATAETMANETEKAPTPESPPAPAESAGPPSRRVRKIAEQAVQELGIRSFIDNHLKEITRRLEECESAAQNAPVDSDMLFIAMSLPILNGVIHIASNQRNLRKAMEWATKTWGGESDPGEFDPISVLSALTLIFVVCEGWVKNQSSPVWNKIVSHIKELSKELAKEEEAPLAQTAP